MAMEEEEQPTLRHRILTEPGPMMGRTKSESARQMAVERMERRRRASADNVLVLDREDTLIPIHPKVGSLSTVKRLASLYTRLQWLFCLPGLWLVQLVRLLIFVILMLPGFIPPFFSYLMSRHIKKNIVYGPSFRHQLDIYLPLSASGVAKGKSEAPVVICISGGAWIIGYKAWSFIMGQLFQQFGVLFIAPDYRNFPEVAVGSMVEDVTLAVEWVLEHLDELGGDPDNITLMGQSAGAHLSAMALIEQATLEAKIANAEKASLQPKSESDERIGGDGESLSTDAPTLRWSVTDLTRWVGISGPYDIVDVMPHMKARGLPRRVIKALMDYDLDRFSPRRRMRDLQRKDPHGIANLMPPVYLFHGTADKTCHWHLSRDYAEALLECHVEVKTKYYEGKSHTDPILEDPCEGAGDELMTDLLELVTPGKQCDSPSGFWRLQPKLLLTWAKWCNPF